MIRVSKHCLKFSNKLKLKKLDRFFELYKATVKLYINMMLKLLLPIKSMLSTSLCPLAPIKHSRYKQLAYKQASLIVRGNIQVVVKRVLRKYKKIYYKCMKLNRHKRFIDKHFKLLKINYLKRINVDLKNISISLNLNLFDIKKVEGLFNLYIRIFLPWFREGKKRALIVNLPIKYHKHSLEFKDWNRKNTIQILNREGVYYLNIIWLKEVIKKNNKNKIGIDQGYNKLISDSNGIHWGTELKEIYIKLSKKKKGSKNYKQTLLYKKNKINLIVNRFILTYKETDIVCLNLRLVKHASKLYRKTNNRLQYWSYRQVIDKLLSLSLLKGFKLIKIEPKYTSQTCSKCGQIIKSNRQGLLYTCSCGLSIDADTNAAINILNRGAYCPSN